MRYAGLLLLLIFTGLLFAQDNPVSQAEELFAKRDQSENVTNAISLLEQYTAHGGSNDYEAYWRLAKFYYFVGDSREVKEDKVQAFQQGIDAAEKAVAINKEKPEGHFWLASNSGGQAELAGVFKSLGLVKTVRREFDAAYKINPGLDNGSLYQALGELYIQLPGLLGGDSKRGMNLLEEGVRLSPTNVDLCVTLAQYYVQKHRNPEARRLLESALTTEDPLRSPDELEQLRSKARSILAKL